MEGERVEPDPHAVRRRVRERRTLLIAVWGVATLLGLGVAATTFIGPVVLVLTSRHGVHLGDLVAFGVAYLAAAVISAWMLLTD
jgi:hypothetical protein